MPRIRLRPTRHRSHLSPVQRGPGARFGAWPAYGGADASAATRSGLGRGPQRPPRLRGEERRGWAGRTTADASSRTALPNLRTQIRSAGGLVVGVARADRSPDLHRVGAPQPQNPLRAAIAGRTGGATEGRAPIAPGPPVRRRPTPTQAHRHRPSGRRRHALSLPEDRWRGTPAVSWYVVGDDVYPAVGALSSTRWPKSRAAFWPGAHEAPCPFQRGRAGSGARSTRAERPPSPGPLSGGDATPHRNTTRDPDRGTASDTPSTPGGRLRGQSQDDVVLRRRSCGYTSAIGVTQVTKLKILWRD
jgi:hypothetical protein